MRYKSNLPILAFVLVGLIMNLNMPTVIAQQTSTINTAGKPTIVLVHGGFVDGSGWESVHKALKKDGYNVAILQHPTISLDGDVAVTRSVIAEQSGPVILVGHSYGGVVITEAGNDPKVVGLVYIAAFAPDNGESIASLFNPSTTPIPSVKNPASGDPIPPILPPRDGFLYLNKAKFAASFAADVKPNRAAFMSESQVPWGVDAYTGAVSNASWKNKPSWYLVATDDRMIAPAAQRFMSKRAGSTVIEVRGSHAVYMSNTKAVTSLIQKAAEGVLVSKPAGGNGPKGPVYPTLETFPTIVDTRHANKEAVDLFNRFFATKSRHDSDATMGFISRDLSVYVDATLGWELNGYDALKEVWAKYMPTWGEGRSYPTRILGEVNGGTGSVMLEFTDTPELFGADMRVLGAVDVVDGKITRWADYWDSATYDGKRFEKLKRTPGDPPLALRSKPAATSARIRDVSSKFMEMLSGGDTEGAATLFSYDGVFEDRSLNTKIMGLPAIKRYLARVNDKSPFGRGVKLGHVVGGDAGGGFEWASSSSPVKTGAAALTINAEGKITRVSIVYDSRYLSAASRKELAALTLEPLQ